MNCWCEDRQPSRVSNAPGSRSRERVYNGGPRSPAFGDCRCLMSRRGQNKAFDLAFNLSYLNGKSSSVHFDEVLSELFQEFGTELRNRRKVRDTINSAMIRDCMGARQHWETWIASKCYLDEDGFPIQLCIAHLLASWSVCGLSTIDNDDYHNEQQETRNCSAKYGTALAQNLLYAAYATCSRSGIRSLIEPNPCARHKARRTRLTLRAAKKGTKDHQLSFPPICALSLESAVSSRIRQPGGKRLCIRSSSASCLSPATQRPDQRSWLVLKTVPCVPL